MNTKIFDVRNITEDKTVLEKQLKTASEMLLEGKIIAFPTETVYGLGANALDENAVKRIYEAKGRPSDNPLIVHIAELSQLEDIVEKIPPKAELIMKEFWPGPISIIMKKKPGIPDCVTAALDTVAVRMPENPEAFTLLKLAGCPVAAPSANLSGKPSPTMPQHVLHDLNGKVDGIVLGRNCDVGIESTVIDVTSEPPVILRPGIITRENLEKIIGSVLITPRKDNSDNIPKAPGMKYTHYAPNAPMILFDGTPEQMFQHICNRANDELSKGKKVGIISTDETCDKYKKYVSEIITQNMPSLDFHPTCHILSTGPGNNLKAIAHNVFDILRQFDEINVDLILSESFDTRGVGFSIMNRMEKAATEIKSNL